MAPKSKGQKIAFVDQSMKIQLYDLSFDFAEKRDHAARRPKLVEHAKNLMDKQHEPDPNWKVRRRAPKKKSPTKNN